MQFTPTPPRNNADLIVLDWGELGALPIEVSLLTGRSDAQAD